MDRLESRLGRVAASLEGVPAEHRAELVAVATDHLTKSLESHDLDADDLETAEREPASQEAQIVVGILIALRDRGAPQS
jgi:hypothetical protein